MRVVLDSGEAIELGTTETSPTISITDFSRRVTDDFGVTTVVERGFARRLSVKLAVPFANVDALQRRLASLRATPARWIADDQVAWLAARGIFKEFELDLAVPPLSYCTLSVEGFAETEVAADPGTDPAPIGTTTTLRLLQPVVLTEGMLALSSVAENDALAWSSSTTYAAGARVIRAHVVYESLIAGNKGRDPAADPAAWLTVGPTNRWAMFDEALGTSTKATSSIAVGLEAGSVNAVALLDVVGSTVRVQAPGYDRTMSVSTGAITFLDLPQTSGRVSVTIAGSGEVSVGTLLIGNVVGLGTTEAAPTAGITDYSRKDVDDFGEVTIVPRSWAKRMALRGTLRTSAVDAVANRIAAVRARPSLWIGDAGTDSLTVFGFFKDFSIEVGDQLSRLSLTIEGLSEAAPISSGLGSVAWPDITDPNGTKPTDNADKTGLNTSKDTANVGGTPSAELLAALASAKARQDNIDEVVIPAVNGAVADANDRIAAARADLAAEIERAKGEEGKLDQRITSLVVEGGGYDDTALRGEVSQVDTAAITRDAALGQRIDTVAASFGDEIDATVQQITSAYAAADKALADRQSTLEADTGKLASRVSSAETALSDGRFATAQRVQTLEARAAPRPNLQLNGGFENGAAGLLLPTGAVVVDDAASGKRVLHWALEGESVALLPPFNVQAGARYTVSFELTLSADTGGLRIDPSLWTGDGGTGSVTYDTRSSQSWLIGSSSNDPRKEFSFTVPAGTRSVQLRLIASGITNPRSIDVARVKAEAGDAPATAYTADASVAGGIATVNQVATAIATGGFASASTVQQLRAEYDGTAAAVTTQAGAITGLKERTASFWRTVAVAGNNRAQLTVSADANGGAGVDIVGDVAIAGDLVVDGTIYTTKIAPNGVTIVSYGVNPNSQVVTGAATQYRDLVSATAQAAGSETFLVNMNADFGGSCSTNTELYFRVLRNGAVIYGPQQIRPTSFGSFGVTFGGIFATGIVDQPGAGSHTYTLQLAGGQDQASWTSTYKIMTITALKR